MKVLKSIVRAIEFINAKVGLVVPWIFLVLMLQIAFEVVARYIFHNPTAWGYETSMMLSGSLVLVWGYVQLRDRNIRVGIIREHLSLRKRLWVEVVGAVLVAFPCLIYAALGAGEGMVEAFRYNERMVKGFWLPPAAPFKTIVFIALCLATLQFVASFIRDVHILIRRRPLQ